MKSKLLQLLAIALLVLLIFSSCAHPGATPGESLNESLSENGDYQDELTDITETFDSFQVKDKEKIVDMFLKNGEYSNGTYTFRKYTEIDNCNFVYSFSYKPEIDMFNCAVLVTTYAQIAVLYDYGSVTFAWANFENALFSGYHELENTASIHFDFFASNPKNNMTFANYQYSVKNNSFSNLTNKNDIDSYAQTCFECINQSLSYAQSVIYGFTKDVTLW